MANKYAVEYSVGKLIICGNHLERRQYCSPYYADKRKYKIVKRKSDNYVKRETNLLRAQQRVRQIVWANITPNSKFLTLTTADTVLDVKTYKRRLTTFIQAMKREGFILRYLGVLERQKERGIKEGNEGSIHAHLIIFNNEYIPFDIINKHWNGITDIHVLNGLKYNSDEKIRDIGAYVCKYITKEACSEWGSHSYFCSKGLNQPTEIKDVLYRSSSSGEFMGKNEFNEELISCIQSDSVLTYSQIVPVDYFLAGEPQTRYIGYFHSVINQNIERDL